MKRAYQKLWGAAKTALKRKCVPQKYSVLQKTGFDITVKLKKFAKEEQIKLKWKEIK